MTTGQTIDDENVKRADRIAPQDLAGIGSIRLYLFHTLHKPSPGHWVGQCVNYFLIVVILANCVGLALETVPSIYHGHEGPFFWLEAFSTVVFVVEYLLRIWVCVEEPRFSSPISGRLKYALHVLPLLDLIVIATYVAPYDLRFLRVFRLTRMLRVLNLEKFDRSFQSISRSIGRRKHLLVVSVGSMLIVAYCFAALIYIVENSVQPDKFSSIPATLWWAIVTLTTIGYGDMTPVTTLGKILSGGIIIIGVGVFALPSAIVTASIVEAGTDRHTQCPHCGKNLDSRPHLLSD